MRRVTRVTPFVAAPDISDQRLLAFYLDLEGGNQRILCVHDHMVCFAMKLETDSKL